MDTGHIEQVRRFNRLVTQRAGALETSYLSRGRPLGEARLIFGASDPEGIDIRTLRRRLGLDAGYLSRLLRALERQGLAEVVQGDQDGRVRRLRLTESGRTERAAYDELSDGLARSILDGLPAGRRERLVAAMAEVERLLRGASVTLAVEPGNGADARRCLDAYFAELDSRFDGGFQRPQAASDEDAARGWFVLARLEGDAVGCGTLKQLAPDTGEIKRLWVAFEARGMGLSKRIMEMLEKLARDNGFARVRLDTNKALAEAQALYLRSGYKPIARYNDNPYAHHWFEKTL